MIDDESISHCESVIASGLKCIFEIGMMEVQSIVNVKSSLKSSLKKKSSFDYSIKGRRQSTGRRLSFSDENGGHLAKVSFRTLF